MRKEGRKSMQVGRERCQFNKNLIKGNGETEAREEKIKIL